MITNNHLKILHDNQYHEVTESIQIIENDTDNKFTMTLEIIKSDSLLYSIFCNTRDGKKNDYTRLTFLENNSFPDGVLMQIVEGKIIFHVIELKKTPNKKLTKIEKQFMSGFLHIKTIAALWALDSFEIKYYVMYGEDQSPLYLEYSKRTGLIKFNPTNRDPLPELTKLEFWYHSMIKAKNPLIEIEINVEKISPNITQNQQEWTFYNSQITI